MLVGGQVAQSCVPKLVKAVVKEVYVPNSRLRVLPTVRHCPEAPQTLQCSGCSSRVTSTWYFVHPSNSRVFVLVPHNVHPKCRTGALGKPPFLPVDGSPFKSDNFNTLDFCKHMKVRKDCAPCGGSAICPHGKRRRVCKQCCKQLQNAPGLVSL